MPTLINIGVTNPNSGLFNYYIGPPNNGNCPGTLYSYGGNATPETEITVDLEDPIYGFQGEETEYCYKVCEYDLETSQEICCCFGSGTTTPVPPPAVDYDRYALTMRSCCNAEDVISIQLLLDAGSTAPQVGTVLQIGGECYTVTGLNGGPGQTYTNIPFVAGGCDNPVCTCVYQMRECGTDEIIGGLVEFSGGYQPNLGSSSGDIYTTAEGICTYFSLSTGTADVTLSAADLQIGVGCEACEEYTDRVKIQACKDPSIQFEVLITGLPQPSLGWAGFFVSEPVADAAGIPGGSDCFRVIGAAASTTYSLPYDGIVEIDDCTHFLCPVG